MSQLSLWSSPHYGVPFAWMRARESSVIKDDVPINHREGKQTGKIERLTASYRRWRSHEDLLSWMDMMRSDKNWVILATETTGSRTSSEVIEIAVISAQGAVVFSSLVNPGTEIELLATTMHGLRRKDVSQAPRYPDIYQELCEALGDAMILGYNVSFDIRLLAQTASRYQLAWPRYHVAALMYGYACLRQSNNRCDRLRICRLDVACGEMGLPHTPRHRAVDAAKAAYALFQQMLAMTGRPGERARTAEDTVGVFW